MVLCSWVISFGFWRRLLWNLTFCVFSVLHMGSYVVGTKHAVSKRNSKYPGVRVCMSLCVCVCTPLYVCVCVCCDQAEKARQTQGCVSNATYLS